MLERGADREATVRAWWRALVDHSPPELVIKPAYPDARMEPVFGGDLDEAALSSHKHDGRDKPGHDAVEM